MALRQCIQVAEYIQVAEFRVVQSHPDIMLTFHPVGAGKKEDLQICAPYLGQSCSVLCVG